MRKEERGVRREMKTRKKSTHSPKGAACQKPSGPGDGSRALRSHVSPRETVACSVGFLRGIDRETKREVG